MDKEFKYCKGVGCSLRKRCVRFVEGESLPAGNWWWQCDCGEEKDGFLPTSGSLD